MTPGYRDADEVERWRKRDPLIRLGRHLEHRKLWDQEKQAALHRRAEEEVAAVVRRAEEIADPAPADMFDSMYAELPEELRLQRDTMRTSSIGQDPAQIEDEVETPG